MPDDGGEVEEEGLECEDEGNPLVVEDLLTGVRVLLVRYTLIKRYIVRVVYLETNTYR